MNNQCIQVSWYLGSGMGAGDVKASSLGAEGRTNPGVTPYKFFDDVTFAGVPLFVAGIIAKGEKCSFRQNTGDNKHTLYAWRLFLDYDYTRKTYTMTYNPSGFLDAALGIEGIADEADITIETQKVKKHRNSFILGGSFTISF